MRVFLLNTNESKHKSANKYEQLLILRKRFFVSLWILIFLIFNSINIIIILPQAKCQEQNKEEFQKLFPKKHWKVREYPENVHLFKLESKDQKNLQKSKEDYSERTALRSSETTQKQNLSTNNMVSHCSKAQEKLHADLQFVYRYVV